MFLELLDKEKSTLFLELAFMSANANGVLDDDEKVLLYMYAKQMEVEPVFDSLKPFTEITDKINEICDYSEKKMILFELVGVMFADQECDDIEISFLLDIASKISVSREEIDIMISLMIENKKLYEKTFDFIVMGKR